MCPEWTHKGAVGYGGDPFAHEWSETQAHEMFAESETDASEPAKRWTTRNGIAFVAHASNDGTWHGYPEPWNKVPGALVDKRLKAGKMTRKDLRIHDDKAPNDLRWALESGDG